jgi:hypothetical protein
MATSQRITASIRLISWQPVLSCSDLPLVSVRVYHLATSSPSAPAASGPELSPAAQWKEGVLPALTHIHLLEMALWAVQPAVLGQLADPLTDRMKMFLRRIAPDDFATNPLLLRLLQKLREAAYLLDPSKIRPETLYRPSTQPNRWTQPGDLDEPFLCRATPAERSLTDKYDNPNAPAADLFSRPDPASNVRPFLPTSSCSSPRKKPSSSLLSCCRTVSSAAEAGCVLPGLPA